MFRKWDFDIMGSRDIHIHHVKCIKLFKRVYWVLSRRSIIIVMSEHLLYKMVSILLQERQ